MGPVVTFEEARRLWEYWPETGEFFWRVAPCRNRHAGDPAGTWSKHHGYLTVCWQGRRYSAQKLIWFWMTARWPTGDVDHRDRDRANNRWLNLRVATKAQNQANAGLWAHNRSGYRGVGRLENGRWRARITHRGADLHLGVFDTAEQAAAARVAKAVELWGEFA